MDTSELKVFLGLKIKEYRNKLGLSQEELAEKIGRSQRQISLIEIGKSFPNPETIVALADVFSCQVKDLFDFEIIKETGILKNELREIIERLPADKIKTLYAVSKNI